MNWHFLIKMCSVRPMKRRIAALPKVISWFSHSQFIQEIKLDDVSSQLPHEFLVLVYICGKSGWFLEFIRKQEVALPIQ